MPSVEQIRTKMEQLPRTEGSETPKPDHVWRANEHGDHFRIHRNKTLLREEDMLFDVGRLTLSVSGSELSKGRIIKDFSKVHGHPNSITDKRNITYVEWSTKIPISCYS